MRLRALVVSAVLVAPIALAQVPPVVVSSQPYVTLTGATPITFTPRGSSTTDEGWAELNLPFSFPYFGQSYSRVFIDVNGFLSLGAACSVGAFNSSCYANTSLPSSAPPNGVIAGVWDDMELKPTTVVRALVTSSDATIEWVALARYASTSTVTFQIKLTSSGSITLHHGPISDTQNAFTFSMGLENQDGTQGVNFDAACTSACTGAHYVPERLFVIGEPAAADLVTSAVSIANFTRLGDDNVTFEVSATLRNLGRTAATGALWRAYLSTDRVLDLGTDPQVAEGGPVNLPASNQVPDGGLAVVTVTGPAATVTAPGTGEYYVLVKVDATDVVAEASESNNVGSTATAFVQGTDLVAQAITGPVATAAGRSEQFSVSFFNRGTTAAGATGFRLYLSADQVLDAADFPFFSDTRAVSGGQTVNESLGVTLPANVPSGAFHVLLQVDPGNAIVEANELNNVVASNAKVFVTRPDVVATGLQLLDPVTGLQVTTARFGHPVRARFMLSNSTGIDVANFHVALVVSDDATFSLLNDTWVCDQLVPSLPGGAAPLTVTLDCTVPLVNAAGAPFSTGSYHLLGLADATGVVAELNEANNGAALGPTRLTAPGVDLVVATVVAPGLAGAGELLPVERVLRNVGEVAAPAVRYRYVASRDPRVSADDVPLLVLPGGTAPTPGSVTLAAGASDVATDLVQLPASLAAGTWFLGCIIDSDAAVAEVEEGNNTRTSAAVTVVVAGLLVAADQLPDAVLGRPYAFQLAAQGAQGALTWALVAGEGELPPGLALAPDGRLSGTPTTEGVFAFTVRVSEGASQTTARLALRVASALPPLDVVTTSLPPVVAGQAQAYLQVLAASGGRPPYAWQLVTGTLPAWLSLSANGVLTGTPPEALGAETLRLTIAVQDAVGARASREFALALQPDAGLVVATGVLSEAVVGQPWSQALVVVALPAPTPTPLRFAVTGALPAGVELLTTQDNAFLQGTPSVAGTFAFGLSVEDARGRTASASWVLRVHPARASVRASGLPPVVHPGDEVSFGLALATNRVSRFVLLAGQLPPGVALAENGTVSGRLAAEEPPGRWDFVVEATDVSGVSGLGAFTLLVEARPAGCSSAGGLFAPGALLLLLGLSRRRAGPRGALAVAALLLGAPPAVAQTFGYLATGPAPVTYAPLVGSTSIPAGSVVSLPFTFDFGGTPVTTVVLSQYGYLALGGASPTYSTNQNVPYTGSSTIVPRALIAPWWDVLTPALRYGHQIRGVAPSRVVTFEWNGAGANSSSTPISFQVELHEATGRIRFLYGPQLPGTVSASVGIQRDYGVGVPGHWCASTASCTATDYPAGQGIDFRLPAELEVSELSAPATAYAGLGLPVSAKLVNRGGRDATTVTVRFFLSVDAVLDAGDTALGETLVATIPATGEAVAAAVVTVPQGAAQGSRWLLAHVDPDNLVPERHETNNVSAPFALGVGAPTPNLRAKSALAPAQGTPGAGVQVNRVIENAGSATAGATRATWFLSMNPVVSVSDRALGPAVTVPSLAALASDAATESVTLPADLGAGSYWLGVCANYDPAATPAFGAAETSLLDNCAASPVATVVPRGALAISTTSLPAATAYVPWATWLTATGGVGGYAWSLGAGALPLGLELTAAGELRGTPWEVGTFSVVVQVASGAESQSATLQLEVRSERALAVPEQPLPSARVGQGYEVLLVATGGQAPWQWALAGTSSLPPGLSLSAAGALAGRPTTPGRFPFDVTVTDAAGATAQGSLALEVFPEAAVRFATRSLPPAVLSQPWGEALQVTGGQPPYVVRLVRFQELPLDATDAPSLPIGDGTSVIGLPATLGLSLEGVEGAAARLAGTPARAGRFALRFEAGDAKGAAAQVDLELLVTAAEPLVITTASLPDAEAGSPYAVRLEASAADAEFSLACVWHAVSPTAHECVPVEPMAQLPPGLGLASNGLIAGRPAAPGTPVETSTFLVKATTADGRRVVRALSLTVRAKEASGCSTGGAAAGGWLAVALVVQLLRRRSA